MPHELPFVPDSDGSPVAIEANETETGNLLVLAGPIGMEEASRLYAEALRLAAGCGDVAVDWSGAEHVCAGAIQVLLALEATLTASGRRLCVSADHPSIRESLELAGISGHFPVKARE